MAKCPTSPSGPRPFRPDATLRPADGTRTRSTRRANATGTAGSGPATPGHARASRPPPPAAARRATPRPALWPRPVRLRRAATVPAPRRAATPPDLPRRLRTAAGLSGGSGVRLPARSGAVDRRRRAAGRLVVAGAGHGHRQRAAVHRGDDPRRAGLAADLRGVRGLLPGGGRGGPGRSGGASGDGTEPAGPGAGPGHPDRAVRRPRPGLPRGLPAVEGRDPGQAGLPAARGPGRPGPASRTAELGRGHHPRLHLGAAGDQLAARPVHRGGRAVPALAAQTAGAARPRGQDPGGAPGHADPPRPTPHTPCRRGDTPGAAK